MKDLSKLQRLDRFSAVADHFGECGVSEENAAVLGDCEHRNREPLEDDQRRHLLQHGHRRLGALPVVTPLHAHNYCPTHQPVTSARPQIPTPTNPGGHTASTSRPSQTRISSRKRLPSRSVYAGVTEICRRLDGMPLAIELAAARLRVLSPAEILDGLHDRLRLLTGGARVAVSRHQTLLRTRHRAS